ncbi:STAS domain-containing protein [Rhodococcus fascians]|nr:STAS domain-containing protein [Rhodococcus fascians]MBY4056686.1 STAS domain-containing protein [Rhodococcus fascians]MBY4068069.1 STAS domain-containing protein [Rhodococcus fascians]
MNHNDLLGLDITSERLDEAVVLKVNGEVDLATASDLAHQIERAVQTSPTAVVVDLSGVSFLASVGMSILIAARRKACCSTSLVVVADGPTTGRPMHLVGLDAAIPIFTDVETALDSIETAPASITQLIPDSVGTRACPRCDSGEPEEDVYTA